MKYILLSTFLLVLNLNPVIAQDIPEQDTLLYKSDTEWIAQVDIVKEYYHAIDGIGDKQQKCDFKGRSVIHYGLRVKNTCGKTYYIPFHAIESVSILGEDIIVRATENDSNSNLGYDYPILRKDGHYTDEIFMVTLQVSSSYSRAKLTDALKELSLLAYNKMKD